MTINTFFCCGTYSETLSFWICTLPKWKGFEFHQ